MFYIVIARTIKWRQNGLTHSLVTLSGSDQLFLLFRCRGSSKLLFFLISADCCTRDLQKQQIASLCFCCSLLCSSLMVNPELVIWGLSDFWVLSLYNISTFILLRHVCKSTTASSATLISIFPSCKGKSYDHMFMYWIASYQMYLNA